VLNGSVDPYNPYNLQAAYYFEWGATTSYVFSTARGQTTVPAAVSSALTGLMPGMTYHCRLTATSIGGTASGNDQSFTTPAHLVVLRNVSQQGHKITFAWTAEIGQR